MSVGMSEGKLVVNPSFPVLQLCPIGITAWTLMPNDTT